MFIILVILIWFFIKTSGCAVNFFINKNFLKNKKIIKKQTKFLGFIKCANKLSRVTTITSSYIFYSKKSLSYEMANKILNNYIIFNNQQSAKNNLKQITNAGINITLPIYKLEFYENENNNNLSNKNLLNNQNNFKSNNQHKLKSKNETLQTQIKFNNSTCKNNLQKCKNSFNNSPNLKTNINKIDNETNILQKAYKTLLAIKYLKQQNINANFLVFVNNVSLLNKISKLINSFKLSIKIYLVQDVNYNLLGAINYLNINNNVNLNLNNLQKNNDEFNKKNNYFLTCKNKKFTFNNFEYSNYYLQSNLNNNLFSANLSVTQNYKKNALVYRLNLTNKTNSVLSINFNFCKVMQQKTHLNSVYLHFGSKSSIYLSNLTLNNLGQILVGNFNNFNYTKTYLFANKTFKLRPNESKNFFFFYSINTFQNINNNIDNLNFQINNQDNNYINNYFLVKQNTTKITTNNNVLNIFYEARNINNLFKNYSKQILNNLETLYKENNYNNILLPKILTENKTLNLLINSYLPQKIIKNYIISSFQMVEKIPVKFINNIKVNNNSQLVQTNSFKFLKNINNNSPIFINNINNLLLEQIDNSFFESNFYIDFFSLQNQFFSKFIVNKKLINKPLNSLFLLNNNLYNIYVNLLYFYLGVYPTNIGLNINKDKSLILQNATLSINNENKQIYLDIINKNTGAEVCVNKITYSNLQFLKVNPQIQNLHLQF